MHSGRRIVGYYNMYSQDIQPLLTIGITCYSEGDWLLDCWDSVLNQTDSRWEAVLIMDGTNHQRTRDIFEHLQHPKLRKFTMLQNMGPYPTRNKAFEMTETPYHFYLDGDDQLMPESVSLVLETVNRYPSADIVYGDYQTFGGTSDVWEIPRNFGPELFIEGQRVPGACVYSKKLWKQLGGFAGDLARGNADYDFFIGALEAGAIARHCEHIFYRCRTGNVGKVSSSYGCRYHETHEFMVRRHPAFFKKAKWRRRFLGYGYRRAVLENIAAGNEKAAMSLAWRACVQGLWRDYQLRSLALRGKFPEIVYIPARAIWRIIKKVTRMINPT